MGVAASPGELLVTVDHVIEGRHVREGELAELIGRKAVARSVSDIAAMAGRPIWGLATAALNGAVSQERADALFDAMSRWARHWGCPLVGGDISATSGPSVFTVTVAGVPHVKRGAVLRSGARVGDGVYVTGRLGGSLESGRHLTFEPRVAEAAWLADVLGDDLHAMIDLSDGLGRDAARVGRASGVRLVVESARLPRHEGIVDWRRAMGDGEDYELCFTASGPGSAAEKVLSAGEIDATGTIVTRVGRVVAVGEGLAAGCVVIDERGHEVEAGEMGWEHA